MVLEFRDLSLWEQFLRLIRSPHAQDPMGAIRWGAAWWWGVLYAAFWIGTNSTDRTGRQHLAILAIFLGTLAQALVAEDMFRLSGLWYVGLVMMAVESAR